MTFICKKYKNTVKLEKFFYIFKLFKNENKIAL